MDEMCPVVLSSTPPFVVNGFPYKNLGYAKWKMHKNEQNNEKNNQQGSEPRCCVCSSSPTRTSTRTKSDAADIKNEQKIYKNYARFH